MNQITKSGGKMGKKKAANKLRKINPDLTPIPSEELGKGLDITWLYHILMKWDGKNNTYQHQQGGLSPAGTQLHDQIVEEIEKRFYQKKDSDD